MLLKIDYDDGIVLKRYNRCSSFGKTSEVKPVCLDDDTERYS